MTPVGGQGFGLGRGNRQLSPRVIRAVGVDRIVIVATGAKLAAFAGEPCWSTPATPPWTRSWPAIAGS